MSHPAPEEHELMQNLLDILSYNFNSYLLNRQTSSTAPKENISGFVCSAYPHKKSTQEVQSAEDRGLIFLTN